MKKIVSMSLVAIFCISLCACASSNVKYNSYICDMTNDGIITQLEEDWFVNIIQSVKPHKYLSYEGKEYCGEFQHTRIKYGPDYIDTYYDKNNSVEFSFISGTDSFAGIHFGYQMTGDYYSKEDRENPHDYALQKAREVASQYIEVDEYRIEELQIGTPEIVDKNDFIMYVFEFVRYINDFRTSESVYICITSKGDLMSLGLHNIGLFKNKSDISIDEKALSDSVSSKLASIYSDKYKYTYNVVKQTLTYSPDNKLSVISEIEVKLEDSKGNQPTSGVILATHIEK